MYCSTHISRRNMHSSDEKWQPLSWRNWTPPYRDRDQSSLTLWIIQDVASMLERPKPYKPFWYERCLLSATKPFGPKLLSASRRLDAGAKRGEEEKDGRAARMKPIRTRQAQLQRKSSTQHSRNSIESSQESTNPRIHETDSPRFSNPQPMGGI